nr:outer membrane protein assembly factor BamA [Paludibacteraceae bacterium]
MKTNIRVFALLILLFVIKGVAAQSPTDSVDSLSFTTPLIDYAIPSGDLTIADIQVVGSETYEDYVLIGFSGLAVGQKIKVPGNEISSAVKRFWKQGYFSDVKILASKIENDSIWLEFRLIQRPRISKVNYYGLKKSEEEDLQTKLALTKGSQVTPDLLDRSKIAIKKE